MALAEQPILMETTAPTFLGVERSLTGRRWVDRLDRSAHNAALAMCQRYDVPDFLARVAAGRGVGPDEIEAYLDPLLRTLMPDPSALTDMDAAAERLSSAIVGGDQVGIFGDYDVDGATSAALLARFLRSHGIDPLIHIPDRIVEGYGPNVQAIEALAAAGTKILVTVDCGSTSHDALGRAAQLGVDVLVVDHHQMEDVPPCALAIVNPNRQDDLSGQGHLAAVGVTFLLLVAVSRNLRLCGWYCAGREAPDLMSWLDLVALGTVADVVPLVGLNRAYVRKGLLVMRRREAAGLAALADVSRLSGPVDPYHLGFLLGPRINAGGRIGEAGLGAQLLLCDDPAEAARLAATLDRLNSERQEIEARALEEALAAVEAADGAEERTVVVAHSEADWHPGIVGLIAARLKERYRRPAFAITFGANGLGSGSGRSIPGVDLGRAVRAAVAAGLLVKGGGHAMAAGLTVERSRLDEFAGFLEARLADDVAASTVTALKVDGALTAAGARCEIVHGLEAAGPFGAGNSEPLFALPAHRLSFVKPTEQGHIRCSFASADGARLKAIAFRSADTDLGRALLSQRDAALHAAGVLRVDRWGGREEVCLHLRDLAIPSGRT